MAGTTPTGYHDPEGADPVEPATGTTPEKNAKPTDVAVLGRSIERTHLRCTAVAGTGVTADGPVPIGTLTTNVLSGETNPFSRVTSAGVANGKLSITSSVGFGLYEITAWVGRSIGALDEVSLHRVAPDGLSTALLDHRDTTEEGACLRGLVDIDTVNQAIQVQRIGTADGVSNVVKRLLVRRIEA